LPADPADIALREGSISVFDESAVGFSGAAHRVAVWLIGLSG
jgi:hypothetical protein